MTASDLRPMRIVHLPFYDDNPYQTLLMRAQRDLGHEVWEGGGGGNFLGVALREWKADLIHFHWLHPYLLRSGAAASITRATRFLAEVWLLKARGARIVWTIHNLANHEGKHAAIERWFTTRFASLCDQCFTHSEAAADEASRLFRIPGSKLTVIPHGNYMDWYPNTVSPDEARERLSLPADARVFLFLGRVEPYKGVFELIEAFRSLKSDAHLVIAGKVADPEGLPEIERRIGNDPRIHLHPRRIPDEDLQLFFNAADVVVFPFRAILTSGSLVLAMSFGKAVVAPRVPSLEEILPAGGANWFEPGDPQALKGALKACLGGDCRAGGEANSERAGQWAWKGVSSKILDSGPRT